MDPKYIYFIVPLAFGFVIGIIRWWVSVTDKKCDWLRAENEKQALAIRELQLKIWSEEKLTKAIGKEVEAALNKWLLTAVNSGQLRIGGIN